MIKYFFLFTILTSAVITRILAQELDSIPFGKVKMQAGNYQFNRFGISEIDLKVKAPVNITELDIESGEKITESVVTLFTGWSSSSSSEAMWALNNRVKFVGTNTAIKVPVVVEGLYEKERDRVKDSEGYSSIESSEYIELYWKKGATGWFIQAGDTIGTYEVEVRTSPEDSEGYWKHTDANLKWLKKKLKKYVGYENPYDFTVKGSLHNEPFLLVNNGRYFRSVIVRGDQVTALWQDTPHVIMIIKKHRIYPYVLLDNSQTKEQTIRDLTILGLGQTLSRSMMGLEN